jgi:hypothetical protein
MNETNKTAVEFLIEELNNIKSSSTDQYGKITFLEKEFIRVLDQVIEMEKEQTKNNFNDQDMINFLKSVFGMEGFDYEKALENFKTNKIISENMTREQKLETIVKILAKVMFYGDWKWETPNERVIEMLMREVDLYPFPNEDAMIFSTKVDENLYVEARERVKGRYTVQTEEVTKVFDNHNK